MIRNFLLDIAIQLITTLGEIPLNNHAGMAALHPSLWFGGGAMAGMAQIANTVIMPVAAVVLGFVMTYDLVQKLTEGNNLAEFEVKNVVQWMVRLFIAIMLVTNAFEIIMYIMQIGSTIAARAFPFVTHGALTPQGVDDLVYQLSAMTTGQLAAAVMVMSPATIFAPILMFFFAFVVVGRVLEIFILASVAPLPMATMANNEWRSTGTGYLKTMSALALQAMFIVIVLGMSPLIAGAILTAAGSIIAYGGMGALMGWIGNFYVVNILTIVLIFKSATLAKTVLGAS